MDQSGELTRCVCVLCPNAGDHKRVTEKALEILRKMGSSVPLGSLGKAKSCKYLIAIELACRSINKMFNRDKLLGLAQVGSKDFQQAVNNSKSALKLTFTKTAAIDILAVQEGVEYKKPALELLEDYHRKYVSKLNKSRQVLINLESAEYQAAAFLVVSKSKKVAERNRVCGICDVSPKLVRNIMDDLERMRSGAQKGPDAVSGSETDPKPKRLSKGQSQQRALKASSLSQSGGGLKKSTGPKAAKKPRPALDAENVAGNASAAPQLALDSSDPLMSVLIRLTGPATATGAFGAEKRNQKQSAYEAARAEEADKSRRAAEEQQREADKKRARFENWKQDVIKKKKTA